MNYTKFQSMFNTELKSRMSPEDIQILDQIDREYITLNSKSEPATEDLKVRIASLHLKYITLGELLEIIKIK